jgi:hypothetical protein
MMETRTTQNTQPIGFSYQDPQEYTGMGKLARPAPIAPQGSMIQVPQPIAPAPQSPMIKDDVDFGTAFGEKVESPGMSPTTLAAVNSAGANIQAGAQSGNYAGMGVGLGGAIGTLGGPGGAAVGGAIGAVGGGLVDMFLADASKEEQEKKARNQEKKKKKWQEYSLSLEERGRNLEDEKLQYARDDVSQQRMLGAQQEMLKTKNSILQAGNLYRSRMGRNWYGPQGITATTRGGGMSSGTTAQDLGYTGKTAESTRIKKPIGMGY